MLIMKDEPLYSVHWQLAPAEHEQPVVQGIDDIHQCIITILRTPKGQDVLRPEFGSNHFNYLDMPEDVALPNFTREITEALQIWEKRIEVIAIHFSGAAPHYHVAVEWQLKDQVHREINQYLTEVELWRTFNF